MRKSSALGIPQNFGTLIPKIPNLEKNNNPNNEKYNVDSLVNVSLMICGLVHTQKKYVRENTCERREE